MPFGHSIKKYLPFAIVAALLYTVAAGFYIQKETYDDIWFLYAGNFGFAVMIVCFIFWLYRRHSDYKPLKLIVAGHLTVIAGICFSCIFCLLTIWLLKPDILIGGNEYLADAAPQLGGKYHGLLTGLFIDAVAGNAVTGFFVAVLFSFSIVKKQESSGDAEDDLRSLQ